MRAAVAGLALCTAACASSWRTPPHDRWFQKTPPPQQHVCPKKQSHSSWWSTLVDSSLRQAGEALSPGHWVEELGAAPEALDINAFGQVIDSTWYTNRITRGGTTRAEIVRGPNQLSGPAPGPLLVIGGKVEGATPGLIVRDSEDHVFVVKFDPPAFPDMASAAESISTKLLYAAGYNVPENYVVTFEMPRLVLAPGAKTGGEYGAQVPMNEGDLHAILAHVNPYRDGTIRALFSRLIPGVHIGNFEYRGVRADDPNDRVPHDRRRSLRGLRTFSAWIHNTDTQPENTYDTFIPSALDPQLGHVVHYLLDFGDSLGAAGVKPKYPSQGYEGLIDWPAIGLSFFTLGLVYPYWLPVQRSPYRAVGIYEADVFQPEEWRPLVPNPAFDAATTLDEYWAASVLAKFTPDLLAGVVEDARYSEPGAREWVLRVLTERQYELMEHGFARVLPLDDARVPGGHTLRMTDLAVETTLLLDTNLVRYRWSARWNRESGSDVELDEGTTHAPELDLRPVLRAARDAAGAALAEEPFITVSWWRPQGLEELGPRVEAHLRVLADGTMMLVALEREVD